MKKSVILLLVFGIFFLTILFLVPKSSAISLCHRECNRESYQFGSCQLASLPCGHWAEFPAGCASDEKCCCFGPVCGPMTECLKYNNTFCHFFPSSWKWGTPPPNEIFGCSDGYDNDCDNLVDCDDPDCADDPYCAIQKWSCNTYTYQCYRDENGQYSSENACQQECVPQTECKIIDASIELYCTGINGVCKEGDKIELNIGVEDLNKCNPNRIEINATSGAYAQPMGGNNGVVGTTCRVSLFNSESIQINSVTKTYIGNWSVSISDNCEGQNVDTFKAALYNPSGEMISLKYGSFGSFTFAGALAGQYDLAVDTCVDQTSPPNGECDVAVHGEIFVNDYSWGLAPQSKSVATGQYLISFGEIPPIPPFQFYKPSDIWVSLPPEVSVMGIYTTELIDYAMINIKAINETGHFIDATIYLLDSYNNVLQEGKDEISYTYEAGIYPVTFKVEFEDKTNYITPADAEIIIEGNGIYSFNYTYIYTISGVECFCDPGHVPCGECYSSNSICVGPPPHIIYCDVGEMCIGGVCKPTGGVEECNDIEPETLDECHSSIFFCYWDSPEIPFCKHCIGQQGPSECLDYNHEKACEYGNTDKCGIGSGCFGALSGAYDCYCNWESISEECLLKYTLEPNTGECCSCSYSHGDCDSCDGKTNHREKITTCVPCNVGDECSITEPIRECIPCAIVFKPLPFFSWWHVLIVMSILTIFYIFIFKRKK